MTTPQEIITEATRCSQEAIASTVRIWADGVQRYVGSLPALDAQVPTVYEVVDNVFDFGAYALATQREFTKCLLSATKSAVTSAAWATQDAANKS